MLQRSLSQLLIFVLITTAISAVSTSANEPVQSKPTSNDHSPDEPEFFNPGDELEYMLPGAPQPPPPLPPVRDASGGLSTVLEGKSLKQALSEVSEPGKTWRNPVRIELRDPRQRPLKRAWILVGGKELALVADSKGIIEFPAPANGAPIILKIPGYKRAVLGPRDVREFTPTLEPFTAKGVYVASIRNATVMNGVLKHYEDGKINALVIDYKSDSGARLPGNIGPGLDKLKAMGIYLIARVVAFKDNTAATKNPDWALKRADGGGIWFDRSAQAFLDPRTEGARKHVMGFAKEAAEAGFDEIQFDYVRYPSDGTPTGPSSRKNIQNFWETSAEVRAAGVGGFLEQSRALLAPYGVFVAADIFGIAGTEPNDASRIGQKVEVVSKSLDYLCPMVYPSGYANGSLGVANPDGDPGKLVERATEVFSVRTFEGAVVRPWLQYFNPYTGRPPRTYGDTEINAQVVAVKRLGEKVDKDSQGGKTRAPVEGWLMWNAASRFDRGGF